jgi:hypothetical protein
MCCRAAGEAFQFDWSEDWATIGGERVKLQVAHTKLSHSRAFLVRAYPLQTHEMLFDAHWHAFRVFGGVPGRGIYDSETLSAIGPRTMVERRLRSTVLVVASSAMSMRASNQCIARQAHAQHAAERGQPLCF